MISKENIKNPSRICLMILIVDTNQNQSTEFSANASTFPYNFTAWKCDGMETKQDII
jgi:hypothetical protein